MSNNQLIDQLDDIISKIDPADLDRYINKAVQSRLDDALNEIIPSIVNDAVRKTLRILQIGIIERGIESCNHTIKTGSGFVWNIDAMESLTYTDKAITNATNKEMMDKPYADLVEIVKDKFNTVNSLYQAVKKIKS